MKKVLLLVSILCLSSSVFSQQTPRRVNYLYYEMDASNLDVIQVTLNYTKVNVYLLDGDNFKLYKDGKGFRWVFGVNSLAYPIHIVPPQAGHWYLVLDAAGNKFTVDGHVLLFSKPKELPQKPPE